MSTPAPDEHAPSADDGDEMIEALEALLATARTQLGELRTTLTTAIGFLHPADSP